MTAPSPTPRIAWLGPSLPEGTAHRCVLVRDLIDLAPLDPRPDLLVVDLPGAEVRVVLEKLGTHALETMSLLLVVDTLDTWEQARAVELRVQCMPRNISVARRDELLSAALRHHDLRHHPDVMVLAASRTAVRAHFVARTLEEAEGLATLLGWFCPEPQRRIGGFLELLINAIEHGNLEISGPEKRQLLAEGRWHTELLRRLEDPRYSGRLVRVDFTRGEDGITFSIEDDGPGFDAGAVLACELEHNDSQHGRGIALARMMSFDDLVYEGRGNRLVGRVR